MKANVEGEFAARLANFVGITPEEVPTLRILTARGEDEEDVVKYGYDGKGITRASVLEYVGQFQSRQLKHYLKSETIPVQVYEHGLKVVVGDTFHEFLGAGEDRLILFYEPTQKDSKAVSQLPSYCRHSNSCSSW